MGIIIGIIEQGLIFAVMALGVYITYKILDFPDLSVDGTFPLGAALTSVVIANGGNPYLTLLLSFIAGGIAGMITGIIHVKLKVRDLLSGIVMMTALYSINLKITKKVSNIPFFSKDTIFQNQWLNRIVPETIKPYLTLIILVIIVILVKFLLDWYLSTKSGYLLRAVGDNKTLVTSLAKDNGTVKIIGLTIANAFVALAGSIYCQEEKYFDVSMGTGTVVVGLASVIIGINVFQNFSKIKATTAVIIGSILYKACYGIAIELGLAPSDLKLITAVLFLAILVWSRDKKRKVKKND